MRYAKTYKDRTDGQRLAEMLALQEANQRINTDYASVPSMATPTASIDPLELLKMRQMANRRVGQSVGRNTYDTVTPMNTQGLA
jgi:hypothetical protein